MTSVKDQGTLCNFGWAYALAAQVESAMIIKGLADDSIDLSEQDLISSQGGDCGGALSIEEVKEKVLRGIPL